VVLPSQGSLGARLAERETLARQMVEDNLPLVAACIRRSPSGSIGYILDLHVMESGRSRGIGSRILQKALEVMREHGILEVLVLASADDPEWQGDLEEFYKASGFRKLQDGCMDNDLVFMRASLAEEVTQ